MQSTASSCDPAPRRPVLVESSTSGARGQPTSFSIQDPHMLPTKPAWFTPLRLLGIFCLVNLFVYLDRGVIASNGVNGSPRSANEPQGTGIQGAFVLTLWQDGLLPAAFMVGLLVASPMFAEASKHGNAFRLIGIGMGLWTLGTFGCSIAPGYIFLIICRMLVGAGEASFVSLAAPFIDDYAPPQAKTQWFAAFYLCIPAGTALGYVYGQVVTSLGGSWRLAFLFEALAMVPFVIFCFLSKPLALNLVDEAPKPPALNSADEAPHQVQHEVQHEVQHGPGAEQQRADEEQDVSRIDAGATRGPDTSKPQRSYREVVKEFLADVWQILRHRMWVVLMVAYVLYVAVLGVYAYWGPRAGKALFSMDDADVVFGGVTIVTGITGALAGGWALDKMGQSLRNANLLCAISCLSGWLLITLAFTASSNFTTFIVLFALGELAIFLLQAPVAALGMWCVPPLLRPLAISMLTISIHLFGDVPSPPLVGLLQQALEAGKPPGSHEAAAEWRVSMGIVTLLLLGAGVVFLAGAFISRTAPNYNNGGRLDSGDGLVYDPRDESQAVLLEQRGEEDDDLVFEGWGGRMFGAAMIRADAHLVQVK